MMIKAMEPTCPGCFAAAVARAATIATKGMPKCLFADSEIAVSAFRMQLLCLACAYSAGSHPSSG